MRNLSALGQLLRRARRRLFIHSLLHRAALVLVPGLAAAAMVFAFGTDAVAWYWPPIAMLTAAAVLVFRGSHLQPDDYALARMLDRRLRLYDALSTALWFQDRHAPAWTAATVQRQRDFANRIAARADLRRAVPFKASRSSWCAGALAVLAAGLFVARYGTEAHLDLSRPLVPGAMTQLLAAMFGRHPDHAKAASPEAVRTSSALAQDSRRADKGIGSGKGGGTGRSSDSAPAADGTETAETVQAKSTVDADGAGSPDGAQANASPSGQTDGQKAGDPSGANGADPRAGGQNGSLMDRMRDAMAGLMAKLGLDQSGASKSQDGARRNGASSGRQGTQQTGDARQSANAQGVPQSAENRNGMSAQSGGAAQQARGDGADARTKSADAQNANSGIGAENGNKDAKMAAQLAAMGKLSEILGKRSQNVTGEVMVDTTSSGQQLTTPWSGRRSAHSDAGGEISRDQIPREYRQYVMQYFEQVHKLAAKHTARQP